MKNIYTEGIFCHIDEHGLSIGDYYDHDFVCDGSDSFLDPGVAFEKYTLFTEAAKNSLDTGQPFVLMFIMIDHEEFAEPHYLYEGLVQFKPDTSAKSMMVEISDVDNPSHSVSGHVALTEAKPALDILLQDFLKKCSLYTH